MNHQELKAIPLADVHNNPLQPRFGMSEEVVAGAKAAILDNEGTYPASMAIIVRPRQAGGFEIIAGHHRTEAARDLAIATIWAHVQDLGDKEAAIALATTNNQASMSPLEHARHAIRLVEEFDFTIADYARCVGKNRSLLYSYVNAYRVIEAFGGVEGQYASVPVQALAALHHVSEPNQRAALLYQFRERRSTGPQADAVVKAVREGVPMREAFDLAEGKAPKVTSAKMPGAGSNPAMSAGSQSAMLAHVNQELIAGFEWTLALYQARAEEYEARFGSQVSAGAAKDAFLDAVATRQRQILAGLQRNPKSMLEKPPAVGTTPKCATCHHGRKNAFSETGYQCAIARARECMPFMAAKFWVEKDESEQAS